MFGLFGKASGLKQAELNLRNEFGLTLDNTPDRNLIVQTFESMTKQWQLSSEAQTALLYRLVMMSYLNAYRVLRDNGHNTELSSLERLTELSDGSVDWSERARDHVQFEQLSSQLNANIMMLMESFGIFHG